MSVDQEDEYRQMSIEEQICKHLDDLYNLLRASDRKEDDVECHIGMVAEMKAFWEGDEGSVA